MGLEVKKLVVKIKENIILENVSFKVEKNNICGIITNSIAEKNALFKAFKDGKNLDSGEIIFKSQNITTKLWKERPLALVSAQKILFSFFSVPWMLTNLYLKNEGFHLKAKQKYRDAKYRLKDLLDNGVNLDKKHFKDKLRLLNEKFLKDNETNEDSRVNKYWLFIKQFHEKKAEKIMREYNLNNNSILLQRFLNWILEQERLVIANSQLTFLQSLWDQYFLLTRMENTCYCHQEYKVKNKRLFNMKEVSFVAKEFLRQLDISIFEIRRIIRQIRLDIKEYGKNFWKLLKTTKNFKTNAKIISFKRSEKFKRWRQISKKYRSEFYFQQSQIISEILPNEIEILKEEIMKETYYYHQKLFKGFTKIRLREHKQEMNEASKLIISVRKQAWEKVKVIIKDLELTGLKFHFTWQISAWDRVKLQLIIAVIQQKKLILIDAFNKQSKAFKIGLTKLVQKLKNDYNLQIVLVSNAGHRLLEFVEKVVILKNGSVIQKGNIQELITKPLNQFVLKMISSPYLNWLEYLNYNDSWLLIDNFKIVNLKDIFDENKKVSFNIAIVPEKIVPTSITRFNHNFINKKSLFGWITRVKKLRKGDLLLDVILDNNKIIKVICEPWKSNRSLKTEMKFNILEGAIYLFDSKTEKLIKRW